MSCRTLAAIVLLSPGLLAQSSSAWVEFEAAPELLAPAATEISSGADEVDFDWGDLDLDGRADLVVVRKEPFTTSGKRTNLLLMNRAGVLTDETALHASASDVPADQGFLTPTNDRDVELVDVDGDAWPDVVTAPTRSDGDPKHIGHPRVYRNLAAGPGWLGLRHEDARVPQLLDFGSGSPQNPSFCGVSSGDLTGNGFPDLYFIDYGSSAADLNDRLLINDGAGYFSDESQLRMSASMLQSAFGTSVEIADLNGDGWNDVAKDTALFAPQYVAAIYNDPAAPGTFSIFESFHTFAPYHLEVGDLNNDGRPDVVISDDGADRFRYNLGNDALGRVVWGGALTFQFQAGGDDGFASDNLITDLDGDGWNDVIVCDVDVDIAGCGRRTHIYHNPGGAIGEEIVLLEETGSSGTINPANGHYYALTPTPMSWLDARAYAASQGGYIVSIGDAAENAWVSSSFGGATRWIGLTDELVEGEFRWESGEPLDYTNWGGVEPNDYAPCGGEDYAEIIWDGTWNDMTSDACGASWRHAVIEVEDPALFPPGAHVGAPSSWHGVAGIGDDSLRGGHDVAAMDIDGDGDLDLVLGRCEGTFAWRNRTIHIDPCAPTTYGTQHGGANIASLTSPSSVTVGSTIDFELAGFASDGAALLLVSGGQGQLPFAGGTLLVDLLFPIKYLTARITAGSGVSAMSVPPQPTLAGVTVYAQGAMADASLPLGLAFTNGLRISVCP